MTETDPGSIPAVTIDPENPWLGLFSYSEDTRAYFHGRDEETAELSRRVQRKLLTILFGQSGLGKTSLLRAGLVPRLRDEGYCPVYVRVDYAPDSPPPAEQIKQAIFRASQAAGAWTRPGTAIEGESLWEFMHHRGDLLRDAQGQTLLPLLIFDQFEEVFTLAQADDAGRMRAREFLQDLADLAENRPPTALEARLEDDEEAAEAFDFARADYRILIALREDYLAHLEGVKAIMPSITQNRMRLARMTGAQALSAVVKPGGRLVTQEVAEAIVRFVAGGSELANAEIEPSLLSLVCRELNTVRLAQGRAEISADLLAGSRDSILSEFYERTLADQPAAVRRVIEDELLTESGYRESLAEERVLKALAAAGATPDALATLVDRRLLRIEERLDMRRVELTHDVLCSVVISSRDLRHEREARDEAQRQLAAQHAREIASHRALVRARMVASVCAVLMVVAIASALFGWINLGRARAADAEAQKSRQLAERARSEAEKLVGFLIEDFYAELEPTGRLDTLGKLAHMTVQYYDGLPADLVTSQTRTYRGMALIREGAALVGSGDLNAGYRNFDQAQAEFEQLRASGDTSEAVTYGMALALYSKGQGVIGGGRGTPEELIQAADLLRPLVRAPKASRHVRQTYAETLNYLSHTQPPETGVATCEESRKILVELGALDLSDLTAASAYADTTDSQARHNTTLGRMDAAQELEREVYALTEKVLVQRPGDLHSLANRYYAADLLSVLAERRNDAAAAADYALRAAKAGEDYVRYAPSDLTPWGFWVRGLNQVAALQLERGEVGAALATLRSALALAQDKRRPASLAPLLWFVHLRLAVLERQLGQVAASEASLKTGLSQQAEALAQFKPDDVRRRFAEQAESSWRARLDLMGGNYQGALTKSSAVLEHTRKIEVAASDVNGLRARDNYARSALTVAGAAALMLGRYAEAEAFAKQRLAVPADSQSDDNPLDEPSAARAMLAHAIAQQGRGAEALETLAPALEHYRSQQQAGRSGTYFQLDFAYALLASALAQPADPPGKARRSAQLTEASALIAGMSAEARSLALVRMFAGLIDAAQRG